MEGSTSLQPVEEDFSVTNLPSVMKAQPGKYYDHVMHLFFRCIDSSLLLLIFATHIAFCQLVSTDRKCFVTGINKHA